MHLLLPMLCVEVARAQSCYMLFGPCSALLSLRRLLATMGGLLVTLLLAAAGVWFPP